MGCPVHIWVPMMAALAPVATVARDRVRSVLPGHKPDENPADHIEEMQRWTPVASGAAPAEPAAD
jgi:hypothetical protein